MPFPHWLARSNKWLANPALIRLAARPPFAALRHIGRVSGTEYRIPVNAFPSERGFVIALTYGSQADWVKNVMAAGGAVLEHGGVSHVVVNPQIVTGEPPAAAFPGWVRVVLRVVGATEFLIMEVIE